MVETQSIFRNCARSGGVFDIAISGLSSGSSGIGHSARNRSETVATEVSARRRRGPTRAGEDPGERESSGDWLVNGTFIASQRSRGTGVDDEATEGFIVVVVSMYRRGVTPRPFQPPKQGYFRAGPKRVTTTTIRIRARGRRRRGR